MKYIERSTKESADALVAELKAEGWQSYHIVSFYGYIVRYW